MRLKKLFVLLMLALVLFSNEPIVPIQIDKTLNKEKVKLGEKLFFDVRLSKDSTISCGSCHVIELGGVDNLEKSFGVNGATGVINTSTVLNSRYNFVQFWDGRARTLEEQIEGPVHNPVEMASNWKETLQKLNQDQYYIDSFKAIYSDSIKVEYIKDAIAEYERSLITPSRFDRYLLGKKDAITEAEKRGYNLFKDYGCSSCHQGKNIGGNMYEKMGVFQPYFQDKNITDADKGRYNLTKNEVHLHEFKVPTLRNIALTYPYLHDGSVKTLEEMVRLMAKYQIGQEISDNEVTDIVYFLKSLTWKKLEK